MPACRSTGAALGWFFSRDALVFPPDMYQLLDFGEGRRLERFGPVRLDRPCPAAGRSKQSVRDLWAQADAYFERAEGHEGRWVFRRPVPRRWVIAHGPVRLELRCTEFGHLGVFPEQAGCWDWIARQVSEAAAGCPSRRVKVLNLFAYTGGSTLAAAAAGAEVTHVDAAANVVAWARRNARLSGLADAPVRWIVEDAVKYVRRELKRGRRYDAVILDPPSYGHGPKGEVWQLEQDLAGLLAMCGALTAEGRLFLLVTCHTPRFGPDRLARILEDALGSPGCASVSAGPLTLQTANRRRLPCGTVVRWTRRRGTAE